MRSQATRHGLVFAALGLSIATFSDLPSYVPTHFNARGEANDFVAKPLGPFMLPLAMVVLDLVLRYVRARFVPARDVLLAREPARFDERLRAALDYPHTALLLALFIAMGDPFWRALGVPLTFHVGACVGISLVFLALARMLHRLPQNASVGFVTPYTLQSTEHWRAAHQAMARLFVLAGVVAAVLAISSAPLSMLGALILATGTLAVFGAARLARKSDASTSA